MTTDMLELIFQRQLELQRDSFGVDPDSLPLDEKLEYIRMMTLACEDELHEALGETSWKSWQTAQYINREAYKKEITDAIFFLTNLCLVVGITPGELYASYVLKASVNAERQASGYDGVNGKCPRCRRAFDDVGVSTANPYVCATCEE